ncbi:MAG: alpha-galactosidase [Phycisphaeraceae bacterium]|nr:alpha-galactosidase [Phycisphaeraceae bacterium]
MIKELIVIIAIFLFYHVGSQPVTQMIWLDEMDIRMITQDRGKPKRNLNTLGGPMSLGGKVYERGIGTHSTSTFYITLKGDAKRFSAVVGLDDAVRHLEGSPQEFMVIGDDRILWRSGFMAQKDYPKSFDVDISSIEVLLLMVRHERAVYRGVVNWADAKIEYSGQRPEAFIPQGSKPYTLTPKQGKKPKINGTSIIGVSTNAPFLFKIPATGEAPLEYAIDQLPKGLFLTSQSGMITGRAENEGRYEVKVSIKNRFGSDQKSLIIQVGDELALAPPMGWNNWNAFGENFDEKMVRDAMEAFIDYDLINHGWTYINMDDGWQGVRGGKFNGLQANNKFSDMKLLCDDAHSQGLKVGLYSTPWKLSYAGYPGSSADTRGGENPFEYNKYQARYGVFNFNTEDATQWAEWGVDFLKYDWYPIDLAYTKAMQDALKESERDIVFTVSNSAVFSGIEELREIPNAWRTTGDITDTWGSVYSIIQQMDKWAPYCSPGHWNDADMLVIGWLGANGLHPTRLTPDEQYTHITFWSMFSSPLLLGCDLTKLDPFTLNLITNDEVIAINQDPMGKGANRVYQNGLVEVWKKELANGDQAVTMANFGLNETKIHFDWEMLGLSGRYELFDVWRQEILGTFKDSFESMVPGHGVLFLRVSRDSQ